jgi:hypothetical protein
LNGISNFTKKTLKKNKLYSLLVFALLVQINIFGQQKSSVPDDFCISGQEEQLMERINLFRAENGKKTISNSISLNYVASLHTNDLQENNPDTSICNLSSWSDKGKWTSCCYNKYVPNQDCMWDKPKELTTFPYRGYELALFFEESFNVDTVFQLIISSKPARDMILTDGYYKHKKWICMGASMSRNYVSIWFAQRADKAGKASICSDKGNVTAVENDKKNSSFYIIVSSFQSAKDAKEGLKRLKHNGYDEAGILKTGTNIRLYIKKTDNLKEAMYYKQNLPYTYNDAWVFKY